MLKYISMDYITLSIIGFVISFVLVFIIMKPFINALKTYHINQEVSEYALDEYKAKAKTPIMGGLLFVIIPSIVYVLTNINSLKDKNILLVLVSFLLFCLVGFIDDLLIIIRRDNNGLSPKTKLLMEVVFVLLIYFLSKDTLSFKIYVPIIDININIVWYLYLPLIILMYLGEANATNFTDGMDGLCAGVSLISLIGFSIISIFTNNYNLFVLIICVCGGLLAYLFYNFYPAKIFMGDSGSLALGGLFSSIALITNSEIVLLIIGGVFIIEMLCVCLQLTCVKLFKRRIFSYTPIHYAFVLKGYKETKIVLGFYLVTIILTVIGVCIGIC